MIDMHAKSTLPDDICEQISRAWQAYKHGQASEVDLMLLWLDAAAQVEGTHLHVGWTISPDTLLVKIEAGLSECSDEQELERRGLGWLSGALEGPRRQHFIGSDGEDITVAEGVDHALRGARIRVGPSPLRRTRPLA